MPSSPPTIIPRPRPALLHPPSRCSQWFALTREHAEAVVADTAVDVAFRKGCWTSDDISSHFCASDEHYIPTLLAVRGVGAEAEGGAACDGELTYTRWDGEP